LPPSEHPCLLEIVKQFGRGIDRLNLFGKVAILDWNQVCGEELAERAQQARGGGDQGTIRKHAAMNWLVFLAGDQGDNFVELWIGLDEADFEENPRRLTGENTPRFRGVIGERKIGRGPGL
jgi:hypothetical protein